MNTKSSDYILSEDGSNLTSIIKILNLLCYIIAVILAIFVLSLVLEPLSIIISVLVILIGTLSLEQDSLYWFISSIKNRKSPFTGITVESKLLPVPFKWYVYALIGFRFILFNSLYKMFPLFLISLPIIMVGQFFGCTTFSEMGLGIFTAVGFLLALFRYYVSSRQKTTMRVIEEIESTVKSIVTSTITPVSFMDYVNDTYTLKSEDRNFMRSRYANEEYTDYYFEKISRLFKMDNLDKYVRVTKPNVSFAVPQQSYVDASTFFGNLEKSYLNSGKDPRLPEMYKSYFLTYCPKEINAVIRKGYDFQEVGRILLANINLLDDCQSLLVKFSRFNQMWELLGGEKISNDESLNQKKTYADYLPEVFYIVYQSITQEMFGDFFSKKSEGDKKKR